MDSKKHITEEELRDLMRSLPVPETPPGLNSRIMERIQDEKSPQEKQAERNGLTWTIALAAVVLGFGMYALYSYVNWDFLALQDIHIEISFAEGDPYSEQSALFRKLTPLAGIFLILLIGDTLFRRWFLAKYRRE